MTDVVQHNADKCPKCGSGLLEDLAEQSGIRRHTCRACGENFTTIIGSKHVGDVAGEPVARMPDDPTLKPQTPYRNHRFGQAIKTSPFSRTALEVDTREEAIMADLTCGKGCGKTCGSGAGKAKHEKYCDGTAKAEKATKPRKVKKAKAAKADSRASKPLGGDVIENVISILKDKHTERVAQLTAGDPTLMQIEQAISALGGTPS